MRKKEKARRSFRKKLLAAGLGFLFVVLFITSFFGKSGLVEIYRVQKKKEGLLQEIEQLMQKQSELIREIEELEMNPYAIERKAREKLWLMRPDELVILEKKNK
ncbi:septum formation initiator family protein [Acidobacteriota bacterium]